MKCSSCGHRWRAGPDGPITEQPDAVVEAAPLAAEPEPAAVEPEDDIVAEPIEAGPPPPPIRRAPARPGRGKPRDQRSSALVWAGAAALAAALIAGVIVFREQIVRVWPKSSAAYAGLGFPVEGGGLVFEEVRVQPAFLAGRPVLSVSGAIHNVRGVPVEAPPVRVTLLNKAGQPIAAKISRPTDATIPARTARHFIITVLDPPAAARDLEVRFESESGKAPARAAEAVLAKPAGPPEAASSEAAASAPIGAPAPPAPEPRLSPAAASEHG